MSVPDPWTADTSAVTADNSQFTADGSGPAGPTPPLPTPSTGSALSGTISTVAYDTRTVIDRAYGALGLTPQQITGEKISIAQDLLSLVLTDLVNTANPLWCLEKVLLTPIQGQREYPLPPGTNDVRSAFYRTMNEVTPAVFTSTTLAYTFDFGVNSAGTNNDTYVPSWAITWNGGAVPVTFQASEDGATWVTVGTSGLTNSYGTGKIWYDMKNSNARRYWRVIPQGSTNILSITTAQVYNTPNDILMYRMNVDDYWNLTNKFIQGRPLQYWLDRKLTPVMNVWEQPNSMAAANVMPVLRQRIIMDVGSLQQTIEVPTRWFYTIIMFLARELAFCTPEAKPDRITMVNQRAQSLASSTWTEERDKSPTKFQVNIGMYTR